MIFDFTLSEEPDSFSEWDLVTWRNYQKAVTQVLSISFPVKSDDDRLTLMKYVLRDPVGPAILVPACRVNIRSKVEEIVFYVKKTGLNNISAMAKAILELDNSHRKYEFGNEEDND